MKSSWLCGETGSLNRYRQKSANPVGQSILCLALLVATTLAFSFVATQISWALLSDAFKTIRGF
ncbi:hypothetical protein C3F09_02120 [candidate division GN15 bacterium]|uniref:Uncharacterized protein n=1 Tax=candidate division GN15 bacterium TaxID=2072418 RepID=A0A855X3W6_9BACT|nr:MAG: hypothetical protein C3F09_02120 [candidate division GN15 bacterium]